jgi:hypothetical protein
MGSLDCDAGFGRFCGPLRIRTQCRHEIPRYAGPLRRLRKFSFIIGFWSRRADSGADLLITNWFHRVSRGVHRRPGTYTGQGVGQMSDSTGVHSVSPRPPPLLHRCCQRRGVGGARSGWIIEDCRRGSPQLRAHSSRPSRCSTAPSETVVPVLPRGRGAPRRGMRLDQWPWFRENRGIGRHS